MKTLFLSFLTIISSNLITFHAARLDNRHKLQNLTNWQLSTNQNRKSAPVGLILLRCLRLIQNCRFFRGQTWSTDDLHIDSCVTVYLYEKCCTNSLFNKFPDCDLPWLQHSCVHVLTEAGLIWIYCFRPCSHVNESRDTVCHSWLLVLYSPWMFLC